MISRKMNEQVLDGALRYHKKYLDGPYKGYYITIDYKPPVYIVYIHATFYNLPGKARLEAFLKEHESTTQYLSKAEAKQHTIKLRIIEPSQKKWIPNAINDSINPVIQQLLACKYQTGCINCGDNDVKLDCYDVSTYHHYLCEECVVEIEQEFKDKQIKLKEQLSDPIPGTLGAIGGGLIGVILWVILYSYNLFAWIAGLAIMICVYKGYRKLGSRIDKKGFLISNIIICVMIFLANHFAWAWNALDAAKSAGYSVGEIVLLWDVLSEFSVTARYIFDLVIGFGLSFILGFKIIKKTYKESIGVYSLKKCP